jgi:hypothetical protein
MAGRERQDRLARRRAERERRNDRSNYTSG